MTPGARLTAEVSSALAWFEGTFDFGRYRPMAHERQRFRPRPMAEDGCATAGIAIGEGGVVKTVMDELISKQSPTVLAFTNVAHGVVRGLRGHGYCGLAGHDALAVLDEVIELLRKHAKRCGNRPRCSIAETAE